jgi:ABC-type multidrug transport system fused ATPase/permease subunit
VEILQAEASSFHSCPPQVIRAPTSWFEKTPIGRVLNRFSSDIETLDKNVMDSLGSFIECTLNTLAVVVVRMMMMTMTTMNFNLKLTLTLMTSGDRQPDVPADRRAGSDAPPLLLHLPVLPILQPGSETPGVQLAIADLLAFQVRAQGRYHHHHHHHHHHQALT